MKIRLIRLLLRLLRLILRFFPRKLPLTADGFIAWCDRFFELYPELPDNDSMRHSMAVMIQHLPPQTNVMSDSYLAASLHKAIANEVAFDFIQKVREKRKVEAQQQTVQGSASEVV